MLKFTIKGMKWNKSRFFTVAALNINEIPIANNNTGINAKGNANQNQLNLVLKMINSKIKTIKDTANSTRAMIHLESGIIIFGN